MIIVFFIILLIGLGAFAFVFMKALKGVEAAGAGPLRPEHAAQPPEASPVPISFGIPAQRAALVLEPGPAREPDEAMVAKLEQMIDEKNRLITELQKAAQSGQDHDAQVDGLKQILQGQIEELKQQNRALKAENARLAQENTDLQAKVFAADVSRERTAGRLEVARTVSTSPADASPAPSGIPGRTEAKADVDGSANTLSLHDVFGEEEEKS